VRAHRRFASVLIAATALVIGFVPPTVGQDFAVNQDFWKGAASVTQYTVYSVPVKEAKKFGLRPTMPPDAELAMVCAGVWNITYNYDNSTNGSVTIDLTSDSGCFRDFGVAGTSGSWFFAAKGQKFGIYYNGCASTPAGGDDPTISQCASKDVVYSVSGRLPGVGGKSATSMHLNTGGLSRGEIKKFVRAMRAVR